MSDISTFAELYTSWLHHDVVFMNKEYAAFRNVIPKVYEYLKNIAFAPFHPFRQDWNQKLQAGRDLFKNPTVQQYFKENLAVTNDDALQFAQENTACWAMQAKARNLAFCYTCSGRSNHFFRDGKALIDQQTCDSFVRDCSRPLTSLVKFVRALQFLPTLSDNLRQLDVYLNAHMRLDYQQIGKYFEAFHAENIQMLIQEATTTKESPVHATMCSKFLRLREETIITQMRKIFQVGSDWLVTDWGIKEYLDQVSAQIQANIRAYDAQFSNSLTQSTTNWKISSSGGLRRLQFSGNLLVSDSTIIQASDPSYTSVGVSGKSPMDMGHAFP